MTIRPGDAPLSVVSIAASGSSPIPSATEAVAGPTPEHGALTTATVSAQTNAPVAPVPIIEGPWLTAALLAAVLTAVVTVMLARRKHLEEERARLMTTFSEASKSVAAYLEMPYAIRRRNHEEPAAERVRLSQEMAKTQADLSYYLAWTGAESAAVGEKYEELVSHVRRAAGTACHDAWLDAAPTSDAEMNIPPSVIDLSPIRPYEVAYAAEARDHLDRYLNWRAMWRRPGRL